ncbi:MAG TPA: threonine/serine dehydratase [Bryobacteraceae bacterium]
MSAPYPSLADIRAAREAIAGTAIRTPLVRLNVDGPPPVYLKLENLQPIGSFKIRGAANAIAHMSADELRRGVMTASAGNMAQGVAWCARERGIPCTVISPEGASATKMRAIEKLGARLLQAPFDDWWRAFEERAYPGIDATFIHAFDDLNVMAGNGTIGLEILEDLPDLDAVVIPWGGGGLACGIASAVKQFKPSVKVFAAEVEVAAPLMASWNAGSPQVIQPVRSFVDGVGGKSVLPRMFDLARQLLDGCLVAQVDEVASAIKLIAARNHMIAEGAGATALACVLAGKGGAGKTVCVVSGGNIDMPKFIEILSAE